jgi:hypothetical protein
MVGTASCKCCDCWAWESPTRRSPTSWWSWWTPPARSSHPGQAGGGQPGPSGRPRPGAGPAALGVPPPSRDGPTE